MQIHRRAGTDARLRTADDKCAGARLCGDQPSLFQIAIDLTDGHRRDAGRVGKLAHRGKALAFHQFAARDAIFDQAAELHSDGDGEVAVDSQFHKRIRSDVSAS